MWFYGSPDVQGPGSEPRTPPLSPTLQSSFQVTITQQAVHDSGFVQWDHPEYGSDLVYSNYYLFPNLKDPIGGVSAIQTMNDSSLWWKPGWKDRHKTL